MKRACPPTQLGIADPKHYPRDVELVRVLALPFKRQ